VIDGSTRAARHAGAQHAIADTPASIMTTAIQATGPDLNAVFVFYGTGPEDVAAMQKLMSLFLRQSPQ
jgi:hypothetical protein